MTLHTLSAPLKRIRFFSMLRYVLTLLRVVLDSPHLLHVQLQQPLQELLPQISRSIISSRHDPLLVAISLLLFQDERFRLRC